MVKFLYGGCSMTDYRLLLEQLESFCRAEPFYVPLFANASALLWQALPEINWAGFYILRDDTLVLGPFQGKPACIRIGPGRGVCGAAVRDGRVLRVADVHVFPGHIACDSASNAEIVLPLCHGGAPKAVLDLDSPVMNRFDEADEAGLCAFAAMLEQYAVYE